VKTTTPAAVPDQLSTTEKKSESADFAMVDVDDSSRVSGPHTVDSNSMEEFRSIVWPILEEFNNAIRVVLDALINANEDPEINSDGNIIDNTDVLDNINADINNQNVENKENMENMEVTE